MMLKEARKDAESAGQKQSLKLNGSIPWAGTAGNGRARASAGLFPFTIANARIAAGE